MAARNLTLRLDEEVIRKARVVAAKRGTSISKLVARTIEELVDRDDAYEQARLREGAKMREGYSMGTGGRVRWTRDELHERR